MKKDAYFFPHFCNARHDRKVKRIIKELGVEGYGIYFMLLEVLREQSDFKFPMEDIDLLADEFGTSEQKVRAVVCNYHLFDVDEEERFFSMKLIFYLQPYIEKTERARNAARIKWDKVRELNAPDANAYANAVQMQCVGNADAMQGEERRGEESKGEVGEYLIPSSTVERIDYRTISELYHSCCPSLPRIEKLTEKRKQAIRSAVKSHGSDVFESLFARAEASDFLTGRKGDWSCGFDWLLKPSNLVKVIEGTYDNKGYQPKSRYEESVMALHNWTPPEEN